MRRRRVGIRAYCKMDVNRASAVPSGIDRLERRSPRCVGNLVSAKIFLAAGVEARILNVGVNAICIAVPYVDNGASDGGA